MNVYFTYFNLTAYQNITCTSVSDSSTVCDVQNMSQIEEQNIWNDDNKTKYSDILDSTTIHCDNSINCHLSMYNYYMYLFYFLIKV